MKFRYIDNHTADIPKNFAVVRASTLPEALMGMFRVAAGFPEKNFIVWNPSAPLMSDPQKSFLHEARTDCDFQIVSAFDMKSQAEKASLRCRIKEKEDSKGDAIERSRARLRRIFGARLDVMRNAALEASRQSIAGIHAIDYAVQGGLSGLGQVLKVDRRRFHVDKSKQPYLRLICAAEGLGTFGVDIDDCVYSNSDGQIHGEISDKTENIWVMPTGSFALMRCGGLWDSVVGRPAVHSPPFDCDLAKAGDLRVFERCDFKP